MISLTKKPAAVAALVIAVLALPATANAASSENYPKSKQGSGSGSVSTFSMATESGGIDSENSNTVGEVLADLSAVARAAGGLSTLAKTAQVIYQTWRICPACFYI